MNNQNNGGPAFPITGVFCEGMGMVEPKDGMSLRDYFAAKALPVAWAAADAGYWEPTGESINSDIAECAYQIADAMLAARDKQS